MFSFFNKSQAKEPLAENAYAFSFASLTTEEPLPLSQFQGKVILVVNTASKCGFTPQYESLEKLYEKYKDEGLVIVGVPSDNFGGQEFDKNDDVAAFCKKNFGVTFPMAKKEDVKGEKAAPFYVWAKKKLGTLSAPKWNFSKYLINQRGELVDYYISTTEPLNSKLEKKINELLNSKKTVN